MRWQRVKIKNQANGSPITQMWRKESQAVVINPGDLNSTDLALNPSVTVYLLISHVALDTCARLAELKENLKGQFYTHQVFLPALQRLPSLARQARMCGVYIPKVEQIWQGSSGGIQSLGIAYELQTGPNPKRLVYKFG